jgi:hypothetical protein
MVFVAEIEECHCQSLASSLRAEALSVAKGLRSNLIIVSPPPEIASSPDKSGSS